MIVHYCFVLLLWATTLAGQPTEIPHELRLIEDLFSHHSYYRSTVRPVENFNDTTDVKINLFIQRIVELDLKNQILSLSGYLEMSWKDPFLVWNVSEYRIDMVRLRADQIWIPDVVLENSLYEEEVAERTPLVEVWFDGLVNYPPSVLYHSACIMDIKYYPFDKQICHLKFESWSYREKELFLSFKKKSPSWGQLNQGSEIEVDTKLSRLITEDEPYRKLRVILYLRRKHLYYMHAIILPSVVVSMLSLLVFRLSPESGEKISLGVTLMLVFHLLLWSVAEKVPESGDSIPLISVYLSFVMLMCAVSVVMSVLVLNIHGQTSAEVPNSIKWLLIDKLAPLLLNVKSREKNNEELLEMHDLKQRNKPRVRVRHRPRNLVDRRLEQLTKLVEQLAKCQQSKEQKETLNADQWKTVAQVIDRMLFWFFFVVLTGIAIVLLFVIPFTA